MHAVAPIRVGVLIDWPFEDALMRDDFVKSLELVFDDAMARGVLDRPMELLVREADGLPLGTAKAVIDAYAELVEEGCLIVVGPSVSENAVPLREEIERRFRVPAINACGSEDWPGKWTFFLPAGSMTDEPIVWAHLLSQAGHETVGVFIEQSLIGKLYAMPNSTFTTHWHSPNASGLTAGLHDNAIGARQWLYVGQERVGGSRQSECCRTARRSKRGSGRHRGERNLGTDRCPRVRCVTGKAGRSARRSSDIGTDAPPIRSPEDGGGLDRFNIEFRLRVIDILLSESDPLDRLELLQERIDLRRQLANSRSADGS
jgi:hypothetical protein